MAANHLFPEALTLETADLNNLDASTHAILPLPGQISAIGLRARYAMSGTGIACADIGLRACYAMSGSCIAYATIGLRARCVVLRQRICLAFCDALCSTAIAYAA
eukprot:1416388-Rhodomonas_salina.1